MKSELDRILKSDLSEYKIAVSDHILNLDHFQQCLTERSAYMKSLNQFLKQQITRYQQDPPTQFDAIELPSSQRPPSHLPSNYLQFPFSTQSCSMSQVLKTERKTDNLLQTCTKLQVDLKLVHKLVDEAKILMSHKMEETKKILLRDLSSNIAQLVEKISCLYETKVRRLEATIDQLRKQNEVMKNKQKHWNQKYLLSQTVHRLIGCEEEEKASLEKSLPRGYSPIQTYESIHTQHPALNEQSDLHTKRQLYSSDRQHPCFMGAEKNLTEMTIKNNNQVSWKHFLCDIQNTTLKEIKQVHKPRKGKQNFITEIGPNSSIFFNRQQCQKGLSQISEPSFPVLLRRTVTDKSYDIPIIRALLVSYPPIEEGFSTLKLGNEIVYRGMWKFRKFHGKGKLCLPEYSYEGDFQQGLFHGRGSLKIGSMEYVGQFSENKVEGEGTLKMGSKNISGRWKNGSLVEKY